MVIIKLILCIILSKAMSKIRYKQNKINIFQNAKKGDADAQCKLAKQYFSNNEYDKAFEWYEKSANGGNIESYYILANLYYYGKGTEKNSIKAIEWFEKSANRGNIRAQISRGIIYYYKILGMNRKYESLIQWLVPLYIKDKNSNAKNALECIYNGYRKPNTPPLPLFMQNILSNNVPNPVPKQLPQQQAQRGNLKRTLNDSANQAELTESSPAKVRKT